MLKKSVLVSQEDTFGEWVVEMVNNDRSFHSVQHRFV